MVKSSKPPQELHLGQVQGSIKLLASPRAQVNRKETFAQDRIMLADAEASTTEEPDAGKPHVRVCMGGIGRPIFLP